MLFHGLGGKHQDMEPLATQFLAPAGYASLECDARGHGASEGLFGLDGPRDVQDTKELFAWLAARPRSSDTQIGALGISLGGGAVWNAPTTGVPFKAIVPVITWTNLATALAPQGLSKSGLVSYSRRPRADEPLGPGAPRRAAGPRRRARTWRRRTRSRAARSPLSKLAIDHDADTADPGPPRLPLRHRPGARGVQGARGPEARSTSATSATRPAARPARAGAAELLRRGRQVVRPLPEGHAERRSTSTSSSSRHDPWDGKTTTYTAPAARRRRSRSTLPGIDDDERRERQGRAQRPHHRRPARDVRRLDGRRPRTRARRTGTGSSRCSRSRATRRRSRAGGVKLSAASGTVTIKLMNEAVRVRGRQEARRSISARRRSPRARRTRSISRPCSRTRRSRSAASR